MLAIIAALVLGAAMPLAVGDDPPVQTILESAPQPGKLRDELAAKFRAMTDADHGVFHDDVSSIVAPYFPKGQTFAEVQKVLQQEKLGPLRRFHGKGDGDNAVYVSSGALVEAADSDAHVVLDFDFAGPTEAEMKLTWVKAYLEAPSM